MADRHENLAALLLRAAVMFPRIEIVPVRHNDDLGPARLAIGFGPVLDRRGLRRPEAIRVGKIAVLAEQVGNDRTIATGKVEQRRLGCNRAAADKPRFQFRAGWAGLAGTIAKVHAVRSLTPGGGGRMTDGQV